MANEFNSDLDTSYHDNNEEEDNSDTEGVPAGDLTKRDAVDDNGAVISNNNIEAPSVDDTNSNNNNEDNDGDNDDNINNGSDNDISTG